ncbi:MAG: YaiO family outer membrane beta-barrel protein [Salinibacter sp.]
MLNRFLLLLVFCGVAVLGERPCARAQDSSAAESVWEAAVRYDYDRVSGGRADWQRWTAVLQRDIPRGTVVATVVRQRRYDTADEGVALDVWQELWTNAYGHFRVGIGPGARIRPQRSLRAEVYQSIGSWELVGHYDWRRYVGDDVHLFGPGLARYVGAWYLRTRTTIAPRPSTWAVSQRVGIRRFYYGPPSPSHVDLEGGVGRSVELIGPNGDLLVAPTFFVSLRVRHFLTDRLGLTASLRYSDDGPFARTGGSVGLFARW